MPESPHLCASYGSVLLPQNNCTCTWQLAKFNKSAKLAFLHSKISATWNKVLTNSRRHYPAAEEEWDNLPLGFTGISWQQRHGKTPKPWLYSRLCKAVSSSRHMLLPIFLTPNPLLSQIIFSPYSSPIFYLSKIQFLIPSVLQSVLVSTRHPLIPPNSPQTMKDGYISSLFCPITASSCS